MIPPRHLPGSYVAAAPIVGDTMRDFRDESPSNRDVIGKTLRDNMIQCVGRMRLPTMKQNCEACGVSLFPDDEAYVCSFGNTFCLGCFLDKQKTCPVCGGELARRPKRKPGAGEPERRTLPSSEINRSSLIWIVSCAVWAFVALAATLTIWQLYRST